MTEEVEVQAGRPTPPWRGIVLGFMLVAIAGLVVYISIAKNPPEPTAQATK